MPHWSIDDEPAEPEQTAIMAAQSSPAAEPAPAPLAPAERVVEIIERFYIWDARLTGELLGELSRCSPQDLAKLFGPPPTKRPPAYGPPAVIDVSTVDTPPAIVAGPPPADTALPAAPAGPVPMWSADGRRLNPGRRAFNYPMPQVRGSHWSR